MSDIRSDSSFCTGIAPNLRYGDDRNFHEKPLADPAVNIQTDFNAFNIYVPVHQIRFALRAASPVHLVYVFAAGGLTRRT